MRKKHPGELYVTWYLYFFSLLLFGGLGGLAEYNKIPLTELCGSWEPTCKTVHHALTNINDELILLAAITILGIGPQILAYIFSAPFGAARTPAFVGTIQLFVWWSYVKFLTVLSGIMTAAGATAIIARRPTDTDQLLIALMLLAAAFGTALMVASKGKHWRILLFGNEKWVMPYLQRWHSFATRNARAE